MNESSRQGAPTEVEYPDGSKFTGEVKLDEEGKSVIFPVKGVYKKKATNNNSYYKKYEGPYENGVREGENCRLDIKLNAYPRVHPFVNTYE